MKEAYTEFKFKCFGDAYTALQNLYTQGNDMNYVSYKYLVENVMRCEFIAAKQPDSDIWKEMTKIEDKPEYEKFGWLNSDGWKIDPLDRNDHTQDVWILYLPKPRSFEGIINK